MRSNISTTVDEVAVDVIAEVIGCKFIMSRLGCHRHPLAFATASVHVLGPSRLTSRWRRRSAGRLCGCRTPA